MRIKNFIRMIIGLFSFVNFQHNKKQATMYCNLVSGSIFGGPDRFLRNFMESNAVKGKVNISNWALYGCHSALVFSSSWGNSFAKLSKLYGVKTFLRVDGFYVPEDKVDQKYQTTDKYKKWLNQRLAKDLKLFDHVIYQSHFSKSICDQYLHKRDNNFSIIPNGTNINLFVPKIDRRPGPTRLLILGKHYPKHLLLGISVMKKVLEYTDVELIIVGPMRNGEDSVRSFIEHQNLPPYHKNKVKILGPKNYKELPAVLSDCDILLHVKVGDWCPNAVLEAMSCGLPVVCPLWGGTHELVGEAGVSVEGPEWTTSKNLAAGMAQGVLDIEKQLAHYKALARRRVEENFNIEDISRTYLNTLGLTSWDEK